MINFGNAIIFMGIPIRGNIIMKKKTLDQSAYGGVPGSKYIPYLGSHDGLGGSPLIMIFGAVLAVIFAASTAYSGMKAGLTVSAGIPGAILGSGLVAAFAKKKGDSRS
jgi:Predicted membrane protein